MPSFHPAHARFGLKFGSAVLVAALAGALVLSLGSDDRTEERVAAERLVIEAEHLLARDPRRAALLARASAELHPSIDAERAMLAVALAHRGVSRVIQAHTSSVTAATRTKRAVVSAGNDRLLRIWDPRTGALLAERKQALPIVALAASRSGSLVASSDSAGEVRIWNVTDPLRPTAVTVNGRVRRGSLVLLAFAADDTRLLGLDGSGLIRRWDPATGVAQPRIDLNDTRGRVPWRGRQVAITHADLRDVEFENQSILTVATRSRHIVRVELSSMRGETVVPAREVQGEITGLAQQGYGEPSVAVASTAGLLLWNKDTRQTNRVRGAPVTGVSLLDGTLTVASEEGVASTEVDGTTGVTLPPAKGRPASRLIRGGEDLVATHPDGGVSVIDSAMSGIELPPKPDTSVASFTPSGDLLTIEGSPNFVDRLVVLPARRGGPADTSVEPVRKFEPDRSWWPQGDTDSDRWYVNEAIVTDRLTVAGGQDPTGAASVLVWDANSGKPIARLPLTTGGVAPSDPAIVTSVAVLPKVGLIAAYSTVQEAIVLWSTDGWRQLATIDVGPASGFTVSPDESTIVVAGLSDEQSETAAGFARSRLVVVDVRSRRVTHEVSTRATQRVAFAPDGDRLATLERGGLLRLRSADGREEVRRPIDLDDDEPIDLAWRPDSRVIAVALSQGGTVLVDPASGRVSERLPPGQGDPVGLSWSPDGQFLAASNRELDDDNRPIATPPSLWTVGADRLAQRMCEIAASGPTSEEWKRWVGGSIAPRRLCAPPRAPARGRGAPGGVREPVVAYERTGGLHVAGADGRGTMVASVDPDAWPPVAFDWSPGGALVWVSEDEVHLLETGRARPTDWVCPCASAMFDGQAVVAVDRDASALLRFEPGRDRPTRVAIRGLPPFEPRVIAMAAGAAVVAAFEHEPDRATPSRLYRVDRGGAVRKLGRAIGAIHGRGFSDPAARRAAFVSVQSGGACFSPAHVEVLDVKTGRLTRPKMPLGRETQVVRSMSWTRAGVLQAAIAPLGCDEAHHPPAELYSLRDAGLVGSGRRAYDIQPGSAATAIIDGPVSTTNSAGTLVLDRPGQRRVQVAGGVRSFLVRP